MCIRVTAPNRSITDKWLSGLNSFLHLCIESGDGLLRIICQIKTIKVPNLTGMTAVAANGTLTNLGLNIKISGSKNYTSGKGAVVVEQSPAAGTEVEPGSVVNVTFRHLDVLE